MKEDIFKDQEPNDALKKAAEKYKEKCKKETELCDNPHCEDGVVDRDMYGHPIYCQVCDKHL